MAEHIAQQAEAMAANLPSGMDGRAALAAFAKSIREINVEAFGEPGKPC